MTPAPPNPGLSIGLLLQNPADRKVLEKVLTERYRVILGNGRMSEADGWPDVALIITDAPSFRGYREEIQELKSKGRSALVPVLLVLPARADADPWLDAGLDDIVRMPVKKSDLFLRLKTFEGIIDQAEARVQKTSSEIYQTIFNGAGDAMLLLDPVSRAVTKINQAGLEMFGLRPEDLSRVSLDELLPGIDFASLPDPVRQPHAVRAAPPRLMEATARDQEGRGFRVSMSLIKIDVAGTDRLLATIRDMEGHRQLEEQLRQAQKMEAVGQLAGGIAHDFNNILTGIIGYTSVLQHKLKDAEQVLPILDSILGSADRAAYLTKGLLAFSRKQVMNPRAVDLNECLEHSRQLLLRVLGEKVELVPNFAAGCLPVRVDTVQLDQVMMNLAINARHAMPDGGTLTIATEEIEISPELIAEIDSELRDGRYAQILITDTGSGMDEQTLGRIFEPFFTTKGVGEGTGLGLSISFGIIRQMGGFIDCRSKPGGGSTFRICLPLGEEAAEQPRSEPPPCGLEEFRGSETILLAEDDETVLEMTRQVFEEFGYRVLCAVNGFDAVEKFRENGDEIDLLFFDLNMPRKNGRDAYEEIRLTHPATKVIFTSGYPIDFLRKEDGQTENISFLMKPASPRKLLEKVRSVLAS